MQKSRVSEIIVRAYGKRFNLAPEVEVRRMGRETLTDKLAGKFYEVWPVIARSRFKLLGATTALVFVAAAIYYYNALISAEHVMLKSASQVEVLMQRRNDISINLAKVVLDYSHYERNVLTEVVKLRSLFSKDDAKAARLDEALKAANKPAAPGAPATPATAAPVSPAALAGKGPLDSPAALAGLLAVAEQYPDLKLSANFQSFMAALVEVEKDIAGERIKYNEANMAYLDYVARVPSNFFAALFGFESTPYFKATQEAQNLKPVAF